MLLYWFFFKRCVRDQVWGVMGGGVLSFKDLKITATIQHKTSSCMLLGFLWWYLNITSSKVKAVLSMLFKKASKGWRDGSKEENISCSPRGAKCSSLHLHQVPVTATDVLLWHLWGTCTHIAYTQRQIHTQAHKIEINQATHTYSGKLHSDLANLPVSRWGWFVESIFLGAGTKPMENEISVSRCGLASVWSREALERKRHPRATYSEARDWFTWYSIGHHWEGERH